MAHVRISQPLQATTSITPTSSIKPTTISMVQSHTLAIILQAMALTPQLAFSLLQEQIHTIVSGAHFSQMKFSQPILFTIKIGIHGVQVTLV